MKYSDTLNSFLILASSSCRMLSNLVAMSPWRLQQFVPLPLDELQPACFSCGADSSKRKLLSSVACVPQLHSQVYTEVCELQKFNKSSFMSQSCHNQSIHQRFEAQGVCLETLDPQVCLKFRPSLNGRTTTTGHRVAGQLVLSEGAAIRQDGCLETVHYNLQPCSQWPKVKPST